MAALQSAAIFSQPRVLSTAQLGPEPMQDPDRDDWADRIGKHVATIFVAALALIFAYGYLGHFIF